MFYNFASLTCDLVAMLFWTNNMKKIRPHMNMQKINILMVFKNYGCCWNSDKNLVSGSFLDSYSNVEFETLAMHFIVGFIKSVRPAL